MKPLLTGSEASSGLGEARDCGGGTGLPGC